MAKIILVITGSIAAYKGLNLYQTLKKEHQVELILTESSLKFIDNPVLEAKTTIFTQKYYHKTDPSQHIEIVDQADLFIVYPATQNFIAQITHGFTDSLASLVFAASQCHKMIFPAMNSAMYLSKANLRNIEQLKKDGVEVYQPRCGMLACNTVGIGRAWEWEDVLNEINQFLQWQNLWKDKKVMLNFGRTKTYLNNIRYITNNSSGKMGDALHTVLNWTNCKLTTIIGDTDMPIHYQHIKVNTNQEMLTAMLNNYSSQDIVIACAALNDYQATKLFSGKISKQTHPNLKLDLVSNLDVLEQLGKQKQQQILIGFSVQNDFNLEYGQRKLIEKNLDLIVINKTDAMGSDQNEVILLTKDDYQQIANQNKITIAMAIVNAINEIVEKRGQ